MLHLGTNVLHMEHPEHAAREIATVVALRVEESGLSRRQLSDRTGIPFSTLTRRLNGLSPFVVTELHAIASVLGTTVKTLVAEAEERAA